MIHRFVIRNFKRFQAETSVELDPVTVLVGANNSGKSTILQALNLFQYCVETTRRSNKKNGSASRGGGIELARRTVSPEEFGALPIADAADLWPQGKVTAKRRISLRAEYDSGASVAFELGISYNRFSIRPSTSGDFAGELIRGDIRLVPVFSGFLPQEEFLTPPARIDRMRMQRHGEMVRNLLWELREKFPRQWKRLGDILAGLFPESAVEVDFDVEVDRFIHATYRDDVLTRDRDLISAGSGFHQALQIFAAVLSPGARVVLLDEPDAHLHARLQGHMMRELEDLARENAVQFIVATHSPHLLNAAPAGALRVCMGGRVVPFGVEPEQLRILETVGAMDRMEVVPLLSNRAVVFVESKTDRKLLEYFAIKRWGEKKQRKVWEKISFLYTYQEPVSARVLDLARQVEDLLKLPALPPGRAPVRFLAVGDRDYRTDSARRAAVRAVAKKARSNPYRLQLKLHLWECNEIENHLVDKDALLRVLDDQARQENVQDWSRRMRDAFSKDFDAIVATHRETVRQRIASRLQQEDRRLDLSTCIMKADEFLDRSWGDGSAWCDAKEVFSALRLWLQRKGLMLRLRERDVIEAMAEVPADVVRVLDAMQALTRPGKKRGGK